MALVKRLNFIYTTSMRYWIYILIGVIVFGGGTVQAVPWEPLLERQAQQAVSSRPTVGQRRFSYLRFYVTSAQLRAQPSWWERFFSSADTQAHQYALAVYLFNMFVSTRIYNQPAPRTLTLDYVGVLDGFEMCQDPFDFRHAVFFYHKYQQEVQKTLNQFLQTRKLPWEAPSQAELEQWVQLLQAVPGHQQKAVYLLAGTSALSVSLPEETVLTPLRALFSQARNQAARVAVLYDEPDVQLEDLDNHIRSHPIRRKRTYRWAKDECNYSSYLTAKKLVQNIVKDKTYWETTRVYLIHAYPNQGTFLMPRVGARFVLADGRQGLH